MDQASAVVGAVGSLAGAAAVLTGPTGTMAAAAFQTGASIFDGMLGINQKPKPDVKDAYACMMQELKRLEQEFNRKIDALREEMAELAKTVGDVAQAAATNTLLIFTSLLETCAAEPSNAWPHSSVRLSSPRVQMRSSPRVQISSGVLVASSHAGRELI